MKQVKSPSRAVRMPWDPVMLEPAELSAIKAIDPAAFAVIEKLTGCDLNPFTAGAADGDRATTFAEGKLWVGHTLRQVRAMKMPGPSRPRRARTRCRKARRRASDRTRPRGPRPFSGQSVAGNPLRRTIGTAPAGSRADIQRQR